MHRRLMVACLLALAFAAPAAIAQSAASAPAASEAAVDPAAIQALTDMGKYLQTLKRFEVETELTGERVLMDGQKIQHSASAEIEVERPNHLRAKLDTPRTRRTLYYDGKQVTLFTPAQNVYSSVPFSGIEIPLADLFVWGTDAAPVSRIESAMIVGQDVIDGDLCNQYAFRQGKIDWQIWISARAGRPLPRKLVITNRADEARPQSVSLIDWDLKPDFPASTFTFRAPKGAKAIEMLPRKAK